MKKLSIIATMVAAGAASLLIAGCATTQTASAEAAKSPGPSHSDPPSAPAASNPAERPSALSYGTATGLVKKGVTSQQELLELFGGPSVMTTDKEGVEVWMYDKTTSTVSGSANQNAKQASQSEAKTMAAYFGIPLITGVGGIKASEKDQSNQEGHSQNSVTTSVKTITFIIKFNADKTVKDYSVRQATY
jgi:hypothetical protein